MMAFFEWFVGRAEICDLTKRLWALQSIGEIAIDDKNTNRLPLTSPFGANCIFLIHTADENERKSESVYGFESVYRDVREEKKESKKARRGK